MQRRKAAFALFLVLGMLTVLLMMMLGLFTSVAGPALATSNLFHEASGMYSAEAGLQETLVELENNPAWNGTLRRTLASGAGNYSVRFSPGPSYGPNDSVNNLSGSAAQASYRGPGSVPPRTSLVIVEAESNGHKQRLEAVVGLGEELPPNTALLSGGSIAMQGNVRIAGIKSFTDPASQAVDVHSNRTSGTALSWSGTGTESAYFGGDLSAVSAGGSAISVSGPAVTLQGTNKTGSTSRSLPAIDIPASISAKSSMPPPSIVPFGATTLNAGEYYHAGDLTVNGDLDLKGAKLYVAGELVVNGSIKGDGAVFVGGDTSLRGDTEVKTDDSRGVALLSNGDVDLSGFDGNSFLSSVASSDSAFGTLWNSASDTLKDLQVDLASGRVNLSDWDHTAMVRFIHVLGPFPGASPTTTHDGYQSDVMTQMKTKLLALPAETDPGRESTRQFLARRMDAISHIFKGGGSHFGGLGGDPYCVQSFLDRGETGAVFDATIDQQSSGNPAESARAGQAWAGVKNLVAELDYDRLGRSYFQGLVYSNGNLRAENDVTIVGALAVKGNVQLLSGVKVTYVKSMFDPGGVSSWTGRMRVFSWLSD